MVQLFQGREQRQDHERQVRVHDAQIYREAGAHDLDRMMDDAQPQQDRIEQATVADDALQCVDPQQEGCPERQDDDQQQDVLRGFRRSGDRVGHRVAEQQAGERREERRLDRVQVRDRIHVVREQVRVVRQAHRQAVLAAAMGIDQIGEWRNPHRRLGEADLEGEGERDQEEDDQEQQRRQDDQPPAEPVQAVAARGSGPHRCGGLRHGLGHEQRSRRHDERRLRARTRIRLCFVPTIMNHTPATPSAGAPPALRTPLRAAP